MFGGAWTVCANEDCLEPRMTRASVRVEGGHLHFHYASGIKFLGRAAVACRVSRPFRLAKLRICETAVSPVSFRK